MSASVWIIFILAVVLAVLLYRYGQYRREALTSNDPQVLRSYIDLFSFVRPRLHEIYTDQIEKCTTSEEAMRLFRDMHGIFGDLCAVASEKCDSLFRREEERRLEEIQGSEEELLEFINSYSSSGPFGDLRIRAIGYLAPFIKARIQHSKTLQELLSCEAKYNIWPDLLSQEGIFTPEFAYRKKELVFLEAQHAQSSKDLCFEQHTGVPAFDAVLRIKKELLVFAESGPPAYPLHKETAKSLDDIGRIIDNVLHDLG